MTDPAVRTRIQVCIDCADEERLAAFWAQSPMGTRFARMCSTGCLANLTRLCKVAR
ncbi:MAG: hypothetical protein QOK11_3605 [Pseudonocardiales bacterium]|nr:hypothetical protein [Pseudonocardiales bacterium]